MSMTFGFISPYVISSVRAQEATLTDTLSREARLYTVTTALVNCMYGGLLGEPVTDKLQSELPVFVSHSVNVGYHVKQTDDYIDCSDGSWVSDAINMLGFENNTEFMNLFYKKESGSNMWIIKSDSFDYLNAVQTFLQKASEKGNSMVSCANGRCAILPLSDAAKYTLYLTAFTKGCKAEMTKNIDAQNSLDDDHLAKVTIVNENAISEEKVFNVTEGLGKVIPVGDGVVDDGRLQCRNIAKNIGRFAPAFADRLVEAKNAGQAIGDLSSLTSTGSGENEESCEERMKLSAGWIVCSGLELLSSGMDTLFGYIDSLLNVNVIKLNASDDQGLYKSWSYFRGIATFMLFAVGLVMIIGQAVGGGK